MRKLKEATSICSIFLLRIPHHPAFFLHALWVNRKACEHSLYRSLRLPITCELRDEFRPINKQRREGIWGWMAIFDNAADAGNKTNVAPSIAGLKDGIQNQGMLFRFDIKLMSFDKGVAMITISFEPGHKLDIITRKPAINMDFPVNCFARWMDGHKRILREYTMDPVTHFSHIDHHLGTKQCLVHGSNGIAP